MCTTCGCGSDAARVDGRKIVAGERVRPQGDVTWRRHQQPAGGHGHAQAAFLPGRRASQLASSHSRHEVPGGRLIKVEQALLAKNDAIAAQNRRMLADRGVFALNLVSSPGSGKTSLLVRTIEAWGSRTPIAVIEGDQQTSRDADRIRAAGARALQINTGKGCHLDAQMVFDALAELSPAPASLLLIENVGNLVCPAAFDLGEAHKVAVLSVTEGDDKPLKYPDMFHASDLIVLSKIDLLPYVEFDVATAVDYARRVRPAIEMIALSSKTGEGFDAWLAWLERGVAQVESGFDASIAASPPGISAPENAPGTARRTLLGSPA